MLLPDVFGFQVLLLFIYCVYGLDLLLFVTCLLLVLMVGVGLFWCLSVVDFDVFICKFNCLLLPIGLFDFDIGLLSVVVFVVIVCICVCEYIIALTLYMLGWLCCFVCCFVIVCLFCFVLGFDL